MGTPPRKERAGTAIRRREILQAALETIGAKGTAGASISDIADQVGISNAGVLHHFGSKDNLILEVLRFRDENELDELPQQRIPDGADLFRHLIETAFANMKRPGVIQAFTVLATESVTSGSHTRDYFQARYHNLRREIVEAFYVMADQAGLTCDDQTVRQAAASILAVMDGLQIQWLLDPDAVDLGQASALAINAIVAQTLEPRQPLKDTP
ncbi:MAG: TetR/AcrR family transcriptional regulator [Cellulomonadaceae bacterium]|jgi:AcrR family transcriptional regulator|nr:TetR/AcrR family transcriptional regulator [Cellulomonadaceae bacterium]